MQMFYGLNFSACIRFFVKVLIATNVNTSNEQMFSDISRNVIYIGSLAKFTFTLHVLNVVYTSINLETMKAIP